jgi:serine/threonine protein kinase/Tfp pilus assembly protein PilF
MSSAPQNHCLSPTVKLDMPAGPGRDVASVRSVKRTLLKQAQSGSGADHPTPEELLSRWPADPDKDRDAASLIFQDFCRKRRRDPNTKIQEYQERFPEHKEALANLLVQEAFLQALGGSGSGAFQLALPEAGDRLFGFRLLHELGRGSFARAFLAFQEDLAGRPVVLKVSNLDGDEPQTMALLQHTHIVPIFSVHEDEQAGLRAVCMPYFGGASLSSVLRELGVGNVVLRSGEELVHALQATQAPAPAAEPGAPPWNASGDPKVLALLKGYTYPQAAAWIVARLAEGLQHSHSRGVLHRDIKPSNILLGADGLPLLLDFNLAQVTRGTTVKIMLGGTINYMAPEHLRSQAARDVISARQVDHRADLYSLGMVLFEILVGRGPFAKSASYTPLPLLVEAMAVERGREAPSLRESLPDAPWDLESILFKCLAPNPADRYQQAEHLAEDLQRFLDDRPLRFAPELSRRERYRKWCRRHPRLATAVSVGAMAALLLATLGAALFGSQQLLAKAQTQLGETQENLDRVNAQERMRAFKAGTLRALCLVNTTADGQDQLDAGRQECEKTLGLYQILARDDWQRQSAWLYLDEAERHNLAEDARELLLLLAWARASAAPGRAGNLRKALSLLDHCEAVDGLPPLRALWEDRALYLEQLGEGTRAQAARRRATEIAPACARDHYLLATSFARKGRHGDAIAELNAALRLKPDHYWSLVQRGICYRELGEPLLAAGDFSRCTGLEPGSAWGHYNLGCILDQNHKWEQAIASYAAALRCDPGFALAYLNRGLARLDLKQYQTALDDLDEAARRGRDDALLHLGRGSALEELGQPEQADAAFSVALDKLRVLTTEKQSALLLRYGFAVYKRLPDAADAAFTRALRRQAHHPQALYGKAMLLVERKQENAAIACYDETLAWHPSFMDARRSRAILLARRGKFAAAQEDINRCLQQDSQSGTVLYAAACVLARAAAQASDSDNRRQSEDQALEFLGRAFRQGYGRAGAVTDPDLKSLQGRIEFCELLRPTSSTTPFIGDGENRGR